MLALRLVVGTAVEDKMDLTLVTIAPCQASIASRSTIIIGSAETICSQQGDYCSAAGELCRGELDLLLFIDGQFLGSSSELQHSIVFPELLAQ